MTDQNAWDDLCASFDAPLDTESIARAAWLARISEYGLYVDLYRPTEIMIGEEPAIVRVPTYGCLTIAHPASSYDIPVLVLGVDADGGVYGPADLPAGATIHVHSRLTSADDTWEDWERRLAAARAAGYPVVLSVD
jgi:hypothetical protein